MYELSKLAAGPMVRRVEQDSVTVWIAFGESACVDLQIFDDKGRVVMTGQCQTYAVGSKLHIALLTATGSEPLAWGTSYQYELKINDQPLELDGLLYEKGPARLSFVVPGATLASTRLTHGSCRQPTDRGVDALALLDDLVERSLQNPEDRPQLFVCSGDLIYADSPSPSLLTLVGTLGDQLLGYRELLPDLGISAPEIPPKKRQAMAEEQAGIYAGSCRQIFGLGEFLSLHLLVLSPGLWPEAIPDDLRDFHASLWKVRRALANTAFYALFDDHEITDDWYLTRAWSERVLSRPLGRRMIANGLAAFAAVHACGNTPEQFRDGRPGAQIMEALCKQHGVPEAIEAVLGMPVTVTDCLRPQAGALPWHFRVQTPAIDLRALDTRTMRAFPGEDPHGRPDLLSSDAITEQLSDFSAQPVVVVPAPMAPPPRTRGENFLLWLDYRFTRKSRVERLVYLPDRGDEWQPSSDFFTRILEVLPPAWVCLGGDTHLAFAASVQGQRGVGTH